MADTMGRRFSPVRGWPGIRGLEFYGVFTPLSVKAKSDSFFITK
jgi:hypothetical protein